MPTTNKKNPLLCDVETGLCETDGVQATKEIPLDQDAKFLRVVYFTDPICSACWGIESQLRKLKLEYGTHINIEYRMGGLLSDWNYNAGGISKPSDVAHHWDEVSAHYDMPIDGDVWLEDPLSSSYPPSIAFKAAQMQNEKKAILFLREIREMVFLRKKNIAKWSQLTLAAQHVGLDTNRLKKDFDQDAKELFRQDLAMAKEYGVRGFPTLFFIGEGRKSEIVYGAKPYPFYETAVLKLAPHIKKKEYRKDWSALFSMYSSLTAKEFSELSGVPRKDVEKLLDEQVAKENLKKWETKNGSIWFR